MGSKMARRPIGYACLVLALLLAGCENIDPAGKSAPRAAPADTTAGGPAAKLRTTYRVDEAAKEATEAEPVIIKGSGEFTGSTKGARVSNGGGGVTLNFVDANLREVVRSIMGDVLGLNYVLDPGVDGKVTLQTSRPLERSAVLPALENILKLNGAALVFGEGVYRIVKSDQGARGALLRSAGGGGIRVRIVPLQFVSASEMERILQQFVPAGAVVQADHPRNLLIVAGTRQDLSSVIDMVDVFDVDWLAGLSFGLFPVGFAGADAIVTELQQVFESGQGGPLEGLLKFVPIERLNAVLVVSQQPEYIERSKDWIERLDQRSDGGQVLHVYRVQNGRAADLAVVLGEIFGAETRQVQSRGDVAPGLTRASLSTAAGQRGSTLAGAPAGATGAAGQQPNGATATGQPSTRQATSARPGAATGRRGGAAATGDDGTTLAGHQPIRIIAEEATNSLVILATPGDYKMVEATLRRLDVVPLQVLIEATIAEVTLTDDLRFGLQWFFDAGNSQFTLSELATGAVAPVFPGFSYFFNANDIKVALSALESVTDVNVISSPQVMVLDNGTATLQVGDQVPVPTRSATSVSDDLTTAPVVNEIQFRDTGVILRVTPRVNAGGLVILDIEQEVSDAVQTTTSGIVAPTIQQRRIQSSLAVQNGETVALGGLIKDRIENTKTGVPVLSSIPILGHLFSNTTDITTRTELLVLITPRVVTDQQEARDVTRELQRKLRSVIPLEKKIQ